MQRRLERAISSYSEHVFSTAIVSGVRLSQRTIEQSELLIVGAQDVVHFPDVGGGSETDGELEASGGSETCGGFEEGGGYEAAPASRQQTLPNEDRLKWTVTRTVSWSGIRCRSPSTDHQLSTSRSCFWFKH